MGLLARAALTAQRHAHWLPSPLRRGGERLVRMRRAALEDWSIPLVGDRNERLVWPPRGDGVAPLAPPVARETELRCLLVTESLHAGGMDEFVAFLARHLPQFGVECAVLIAPVGRSRGIGPLAQDLLESGIEVVDHGRTAAEDWVRNWAPDVLAVHGNAKWPLELASSLGVPGVLVLHGMHDLFDMPEAEVLDRYAHLSAVISVSELVREQFLAKSRRINPTHVTTIPNGIDVSRTRGVERAAARAALGLGNEFLFVSLSRHALQKNSYGLIRAFADSARDRDRAHLLVCGRPDDMAYASQLVALRDRLPERDRIHLRDNTRRPDVLLAAADAFVLNSFFEGWALSSMEALASGVPVIVSDVGGAREQLTGGPPRGVLVTNPVGDPIAVNWQTMSSARFSRQVNHDELVSVMRSFIDGTVELADRSTIASDAATRFSAHRCVEAHASALRAVASAGCEEHLTPRSSSARASVT